MGGAFPVLDVKIALTRDDECILFGRKTRRGFHIHFDMVGKHLDLAERKNCLAIVILKVQLARPLQLVWCAASFNFYRGRSVDNGVSLPRSIIRALTPDLVFDFSRP